MQNKPEAVKTGDTEFYTKLTLLKGRLNPAKKRPYETAPRPNSIPEDDDEK